MRGESDLLNAVLNVGVLATPCLLPASGGRVPGSDPRSHRWIIFENVLKESRATAGLRGHEVEDKSIGSTKLNIFAKVTSSIQHLRD
jgi:hypothetical protein